MSELRKKRLKITLPSVSKYSWVTEHMQIIAIIIGAFYLILNSILIFFSDSHSGLAKIVFGPNYHLVFENLIVFALFLIFGSHAQYTMNQRKKAENALRESELKHRSLFEVMAQGVIYQDRDGVILSANSSVERMTGIPVDQFPGKKIEDLNLDIIHENQTDFLPSEFPSTLAQKTLQPVKNVIIGVMHQTEGRHHWLNVNSIPKISNSEGPVTVFTTLSDITELKKTEETLKRQNEYMLALHETALSLINRLDIGELLFAIVHRATLLTGTPDGFLFLFDDSSEKLELIVGVGKLNKFQGLNENPGEGISGVVWKEGKPFFEDDYQMYPRRSAHPAFDSIRSVAAIPLKSDKHVRGVLGVAHHVVDKKIGKDEKNLLEQFSQLASLALDNARLLNQVQHELSERIRAERKNKEMEHQLRRAQKMEAIGTLAGGIAHDFNNILSAIVGYSEMALYNTPPDAKTYRHMENVLKAGHRAKELVNQILSFSREADEEKRLIQITPVIKEALKLLRASLPANITIEHKINKDPGRIMGNPTEIHQVLMNLCTNASHAMEETGGVLTVELRPVEVKANQLHGMKAGNYICLTVRDTGKGMPPETVERIFEPYFTTKEEGKGTGLGLAITHRIVLGHGGGIRVKSKPGVGSAFFLYFPIERKSLPQDSYLSLIINGGNERILYVDDEMPLVELAQEMLQRLGYRVKACQEPEKALAMFNEDPNQFDLIITDMSMPKMTGDVLTRKLLEIRPDLPIIICTGYSDQIDEERAKKLGVRDLIMKPIALAMLSRSIRQVLDS